MPKHNSQHTKETLCLLVIQYTQNTHTHARARSAVSTLDHVEQKVAEARPPISALFSRELFMIGAPRALRCGRILPKPRPGRRGRHGDLRYGFHEPEVSTRRCAFAHARLDGLVSAPAQVPLLPLERARNLPPEGARSGDVAGTERGLGGVVTGVSAARLPFLLYETRDFQRVLLLSGYRPRAALSGAPRELSTDRDSVLCSIFLSLPPILTSCRDARHEPGEHQKHREISAEPHLF